jgi:hypothetical protein
MWCNHYPPVIAELLPDRPLMAAYLSLFIVQGRDTCDIFISLLRNASSSLIDCIQKWFLDASFV